MTQVLPAALVAPTRASQSVGYLIRAVNGTTIATAFTTTGVAEVTSTGYYRVDGGITAPDDGGTLEWYLNNAGSPGTFLSAVAIEPAPNQADQAAGIRAALGLASANMDTQLSGISSKTTNLPAAPAAVSDIPTTTQIWTHATRALTDKDNFSLADNAIDADALATSAVTEIQNGLATASSISTPAQIASQVRTELTTELARINVDLSTRLAAANYTTPPTTAQIATAVEAALLNDADGQALLAAIQTAVQALFDQQADIPVSTLVSLIAAQITADHGSGSYTTANLSAVALEASVQAIKAKTDNLPSDPADQSTLADLINTKASQASVNAIPTTPLLAANYTAPDNAGIAAIKAKTDNLPSDPADQSELATLISAIPTVAPDNAGIAAIKAKTDNLPSDPADQSELVTLINTKASQASVDAIPTTPLLAANYTAPDNAGIAAIKAKTDNLPSDPADQSALVTLISAIPTNPLLATNYTAPDNTGIAAIKAKTDNLPSDPADQSELVTLINTRLAAANYVAPNNTGILTAIGSLPSASTIADAVWDEALSGHLTAGSTGAKLNLASTLAVGDIPAGLTAQQVWEYASRTLTTASGLTTEQNTRLNELWRKAGLDLATPVVRTLNLATGNVTETLGATTITHTETNSGNTVTTARQP